MQVAPQVAPPAVQHQPGGQFPPPGQTAAQVAQQAQQPQPQQNNLMPPAYHPGQQPVQGLAGYNPAAGLVQSLHDNSQPAQPLAPYQNLPEHQPHKFLPGTGTIPQNTLMNQNQPTVQQQQQPQYLGQQQPQPQPQPQQQQQQPQGPVPEGAKFNPEAEQPKATPDIKLADQPSSELQSQYDSLAKQMADIRTKQHEASVKAAREAGDLETAHKLETDKIAAENKALAKELQLRDQTVITTTRDRLASEIANKIAKTAPKLVAREIADRIDVKVVNGRPMVGIKDATGKVNPEMTLDKLKDEFLNNKEYEGLVKSSQATGMDNAIPIPQQGQPQRPVGVTYDAFGNPTLPARYPVVTDQNPIPGMYTGEPNLFAMDDRQFGEYIQDLTGKLYGPQYGVKGFTA